MIVTHALTLVMAWQAAPPDAAHVFEARVNAAIDRGVVWLKKKQSGDGGWENGNNSRFKNGVTGLGFLTLVKSGVGESDPAVQKCLNYFNEYKAYDKTYSTGVTLLAFEALKRGSADRPRAEAGVQWLLKNRDEATKLWAYPDGDADLSNTQYALLGLHAAHRMGVDVPKDVLFETVQAIFKRRQKEGSFTYKDPGELPIGSMTTAAICALKIAEIQLKGFAPYEARRSEWKEAENAAFGWLEKHYRVDANPSGYTPHGMTRTWHYYYLYGLERACTMAGRQKLGGHAWYREGAEYLLYQQNESGAWSDDFVDTCFALLFLKRATLTWSPGSTSSTVDTAVVPGGAEPWRSRPRAPKDEVPFLGQWHVCGPFLTKRTEPLARDEIGEARIKSAGDGDNAGTSNKRWKRVSITEPHLDFEKVLPPFDSSFVYAFATIKSPRETPAVVWLGHDDGAKLFLNGRLVYENESYGEAAQKDCYYVRVQLKQGVNTLLFKIYDLNYGCGLVARVAQPDGSALP